jgi:cytochrome c553
MTIKKTAFAIALLTLALDRLLRAARGRPCRRRPRRRRSAEVLLRRPARGNIEAGMKLAMTKRAGFACVDCHGAEGNAPTDKSYPKLGGQYADYIEHALLAYRKGDRDNSLMSPQAKELTDQQIADLARISIRRKRTCTTCTTRSNTATCVEEKARASGPFSLRSPNHGVVEAGICTDVFGGGGAFLMLPLSSCSQGLNGTSGGGRAVADCAFLFGSINPQPPPNCRIEITHEIFLSVPGIGIDSDLMPLRTHSCSSVSFGTQYWSNVVGV